MSQFNSLLLSFVLLTFLTVSCGDNSENPKEIVFETGEIADFEGNIYKTVKIGNQWWMQEDLRSTKFKDGSVINKVNNNEEWANTSSALFATGSYGLYYNFYTIKDGRGLAPEGWHVATDEDWKKLELQLGMSDADANEVNWRGSKEGDKLKADYQNYTWTFFEKVWGTNESGFNALPCGCILFDGNNCEPSVKRQGFWWTSTETKNEAWFRNLDYKKSNILRYFTDQNYGFAIRCVKD